MRYWYRSKDAQHQIDVEDTTEARHWAINHLDLSEEWELSEYREVYEYSEYEEDGYSYSIEFLEDKFDFPVELEAVNSNWQGKTGVAEADCASDMLMKCLSFGNEFLNLREDNTDGYYFRTASHDVPTGFNIYIKEI